MGFEAERRFDVVEKLAHPLPTTIIAEMLGVDAERIADFRRWSSGVIQAFTGSGRDDSPAALLANARELIAYFRTVVALRREQPSDDRIGVLIDPQYGDALDTMQVMRFAMVLLVAGNETTTKAVGNTADLLLRDHDLLDRVSRDPKRIPDLVEESIRFESPLRFMPRLATEDTTHRSTLIRAAWSFAGGADGGRVGAQAIDRHRGSELCDNRGHGRGF